MSEVTDNSTRAPVQFPELERSLRRLRRENVQLLLRVVALTEELELERKMSAALRRRLASE